MFHLTSVYTKDKKNTELKPLDRKSLDIQAIDKKLISPNLSMKSNLQHLGK